MLLNTIEEKMDMAKYGCSIYNSYADYDFCSDFPKFEEKWAEAMSNGNPYELRFDLGNKPGVIQSTLYVFENEEFKIKFLIDFPDIVELIKN